MSDTSQNASSNFTVDLRDVREDDHEWLVALHNDELVLRNVTNPQPITLEHHMKWWNSLNPKREVRKIFTVNEKRAGFCKFYQIDRVNGNCVLGADLHDDFRGRGLAIPMWHLMLDVCFFGENFQLHRVSLTTADFNHVAQHVYRKIGFKEEGRMVESLFRDGKFCDQIAMYMLRSDWLRNRQ